jgi:hypothetical protein
MARTKIEHVGVMVGNIETSISVLSGRRRNAIKEYTHSYQWDY